MKKTSMEVTGNRSDVMNAAERTKSPELSPDLAGVYQKILHSLSLKMPFPGPDQLGNALDSFIHSMLYSPTDLADILTAVSIVHDALTTRIIEFHVTDIRDRDGRSPPGGFCWISMGSDARQEQVVRTDQDNALIYADPPPAVEKEWDNYYSDLAVAVVNDLDRFGFLRCKGDVMATNPQWRRPLTRWHQALDRWIGSAAPDDIRHLTILLDFRPVYGNKPMAYALWNQVFDLFQKEPAVSHYLTQDDSLFSSPKTVFGRIRTRRLKKRRACFNIKTSGLTHLINCIRILALNNGISNPSTMARLEGLKDQAAVSSKEYEHMLEAFYQLNRLKIASHLNRGRYPDLPVNCVDLATLSRMEKKGLHSALDTVTQLQKRIRKTYSIQWMNFFN